VTRETLTSFSDAEVEALDSVYTKFGKWDKWKLVDYTHRYCREWQDPKGSSLQIPYEAIFRL